MNLSRSDDSRDVAGESLARRVSAGSEIALRELYDQYGGLAYSISYKILDDRQDAENTIQDVFVKAWRTIENFDSKRSTLKSWICMITRSACLDRLRKRKNRPDSDKSRVVEFESSHQKSNSLGSGSNMFRDDLLDGLQSLRDDYRTSIELAYFNGYTHREVGKIMGVPEGTAKTFLRRGLAKLREVFELK